MQRNGDKNAAASDARAQLLQKYLRGQIAAKPAPIPKRTSSGPAPLSFSQQQIWLHSQMAGAQLIYNEPITIRHRGKLNAGALERSFTEVVRRHQAWRTTFEWQNDRPMQIVQPPPAQIQIPLVDLGGHARPEEEALRLATNDARQPFDLARGPIYRLRLVRLRDDEHCLFITLHHIIFDGVSLYRVFVPELLALYENFANNTPAHLPKLSIQYPDYAVWQREWIRHIGEEQFDFWRSQLGDAPVLEFKTDRPREATQTYAGAMELFRISDATAASLKQLSQEQGATIFMTMTAAFMAFLQSLTDQEDIVVGGVSNGRNREEVQNLLGCFLNTVPIRCRFTKELPFTELLARSRDATLAALAHDEVPFELLVQKFARKRDTGHPPLVQALIVVEPPLDPLPAAWDFTHLDVETGTAKFDLQLGLDHRADGFRGCFIYNRDLFTRATIAAMKTRWLALLDRIAAEPMARICDLVRSTSSRAQMPLPEWNGKKTDYPRDASVQKIFQEQVARSPNDIAIVFQDTTLTYDDLNRRANKLARHLQKLGVARDAPVGVRMERSPELIVALLGILKAGGAYVPLDPSYPDERLAFMSADTDMSLILTNDSSAPASGSRPKTINVRAENLAAESDGNLSANGGAEDLAYIMYTSGSTGVPKGVAVPHRAVARLVKDADYASFSPNETFLQLAPISFDASTFEIWGPLLNGGKLVLLPPGIPPLEEIGAAIRKHQVTTLWLTSGLFNVMVDERPDDLRSLRQLLAGGDVLSISHVRKAQDALPQTALINGYGPTESTTFACCHTIERGSLGENSVPIGKPIANTTAYIVDLNMDPVPIGVTGELCIGGDGLARGYWRRDDLTAEKFVPDPFSGETGARLYKTGDLARWREDGAIEFLGRADHQIKLRGFRIEPGEIETALKRQAGVRDAAVIAREDLPGEKSLTAYVVGNFSPETLSGELRRSLPDYMIPSAFVEIKSLPRTANGKLDRKALPGPSERSHGTAIEFVAPRTPLEKKIAEIWRNVLGLEKIGISDNFFELGGHSLAGMRVVNQLSAALGEQLSPNIFFEAPSIAAMAKLLRKRNSAAVTRWTGVAGAHRSKSTAQTVRPYLGLHVDLIALWEDLLALREIGIRDDFFELGGDFLQAQEMLRRVEIAFGKTVQPAQFSRSPTIEHLAAEIARQPIGESPTLIKLNENGSRTPLFYLHGDLFGGGFYSLKLSRALGPEQPFYVLPPHDVRSLTKNPTIEEMAATHLRTLLEMPPRDSYLIGGFCLGGIVAYELAQQLVAAGKNVEMLLLIDAEPQDKTLSMMRRACELIGRWLGWDDRQQMNQFRKWWLRRTQFAIWREEGAQARSRLILRQFRNRIVSVWKTLWPKPEPVRSSSSESRPERDVPTTFLWASAKYRPQRYHGAMAVLFSEDLLHRGDHLEQAWSRFAPKVTIHALKGRHLECITAHVDALAQTIGRCLELVRRT